MQPTPALTPQDYALRRMGEAMAAGDVAEAAFWLGVLVPSETSVPGSERVQ
jgi:hypothetical protein